MTNEIAAAKSSFPVLGARIALCVFIAAVLASPWSCQKDQGQQEDPAERAQREIVESLILPPDSVQRSVKVDRDKDSLILTFGANESLEVISQFFKKTTRDKAFMTVAETDVGISFKDAQGRLVTVMWYARDPDISEYQTVFHVAVQPLPKELKASPAPSE